MPVITSLCGMTAAWFDGTKIEDTVGNWRDYVDIYYFTPYVTLDPNDVKPPEGLQLYKVPALRSIKEKLKDKKLQRREVHVTCHDGNSFFNAVSEALTDKMNTPIQLRKRLVEHLKTFPNLYCPRSRETTTEEYEIICEKFISNCSLDPLPSDIEKILPEAMARTLRQVIPVNSEQEDKFYGTEPVIQLVHGSDHYDYALPITSTGDTSKAFPSGNTDTPLKRTHKKSNDEVPRRILHPYEMSAVQLASPKDKWYPCTNPIILCPIKIHEENKKCEYCSTCKECDKIMQKPRAFCRVCGSAGHTPCIRDCMQTSKR